MHSFLKTKGIQTMKSTKKSQQYALSKHVFISHWHYQENMLSKKQGNTTYQQWSLSEICFLAENWWKMLGLQPFDPHLDDEKDFENLVYPWWDHYERWGNFFITSTFDKTIEIV